MEILENQSLKSFNTFGIEARALYFTEIHNEKDLQALYSTKLVKKVPVLVLGGGSNILFTDNFNGLVIHMASKGISVEPIDDHIIIHAQAGEKWNTLVQFCISQGYGGLENLSLIPGTVGASPVQNIGAYGVELKDSFIELRAYNIQNQSFRTFTKAECCFSYRQSIFKSELKGQYIICRVSFRLTSKPVLKLSYGPIMQELSKQQIESPNIKDIGRIVSEIRVSKLPDPSTIGNAGSFFKNPVINSDTFSRLKAEFPDIVYFPLDDHSIKLGAGWLIEQCGWKGKVIGNTGTWKNQALVLVNHGHATGDEILKLGNDIIESVKIKFGISIEKEVNIISS